MRDKYEKMCNLYREDVSGSNLYPYWAGSFVGPFLHILAVIHALLWGFPGSILGTIVSILLVSSFYSHYRYIHVVTCDVDIDC